MRIICGRVAIAAVLMFAIPAPSSLAAQAAPSAAQDYVIGPADVLLVSYWRDDDHSAEVTVRPDGFISLPLLNELPAGGLTPAALAELIRARAAEFLQTPTVTVFVKQINSRKAFITGEVIKPGVYALTGPTTVLQLIAMAGGLTAFANAEKIAIIRVGDGSPVTFTFNYKNVAKLKDLRDNIILLPGDTVVVS